jgi:hypothetical protein
VERNRCPCLKKSKQNRQSRQRLGSVLVFVEMPGTDVKTDHEVDKIVFAAPSDPAEFISACCFDPPWF